MVPEDELIIYRTNTMVCLTTDLDLACEYVLTYLMDTTFDLMEYVPLEVCLSILPDTTDPNRQWRRKKNYYGESLWGTDWKPRYLVNIGKELSNEQ